MNVKIYKPSKNVMQSGLGKCKIWVLEFVSTGRIEPEPLMGWTSSEDTLSQTRLNFDSREEAIEFADNKGWSYEVATEQARRVKPRNYVDNFKYIPPNDDKKA